MVTAALSINFFPDLVKQPVDQSPKVTQPLSRGVQRPSYAMRMSPIKCRELAKQLGAVDCTRGTPTFPIQPQTTKNFSTHLEKLGKPAFADYTEVAGYPHTRQVLAAKLTQLNHTVAYEADDLVITHGGTDAIALSFQSLIHTFGTQILIASPTYGAYITAIKKYAPDHPIKFVDSQRGLPNLSALQEILTDKPEQLYALVMATPGNPVGVPTPGYLAKLAKLQKSNKHLCLVLDLAYFDNLPAGTFPELENLFDSQKTVYIRSASKSVSLPAVRGGLVYSKNVELMNAINEAAETAHINPSIFSGAAMVAALSMPEGQQTAMTEFYQQRLAYLNHVMKMLKLIPPDESVHPFFVFTTIFDRLVGKNIAQDPRAIIALKAIGIPNPHTKIKNTTDLLAYLGAHGIGGVGVDVQQADQTISGIRLFGAHSELSTMSELVQKLHEFVHQHAQLLSLAYLPTLDELLEESYAYSLGDSHHQKLATEVASWVLR
jgi:aspartate/methionine/tyrosine aminotransferase